MSRSGKKSRTRTDNLDERIESIVNKQADEEFARQVMNGHHADYFRIWLDLYEQTKKEFAPTPT